MTDPRPPAPHGPEPTARPDDPVPPELARDAAWQRLHPRMLLVHPLRELVRFLPVLLGIVVAGSATGDGQWHLIGVAVPVLLGLLRYLTTTFRIGSSRVDLRRGLLTRHVTSTPLDRVRSVDLTATLIHRTLGLTTVRIGTGTAAGDDEESLDLDGLPVARARELRDELLRVLGEPGTLPASQGDHPADDVARFDPSWLRFAPFTSGGFVAAAAVLGVGAQVLNLAGAWRRIDPETWSVPVGSGLAAVALALVGLLLALAVVALLAVAGYLVTNWGFRLRHRDAAWHLTRGLLTTRETSIDDERVAGVVLGEALALRVAGGRHLQGIVTGLDRKQRESSTLVPPSPAALAPRVAAAVLGTGAPVAAPLTDHGPAARRRRWARAVGPATAVVVLAALAVALGAPWWLVPLALAGLAASVVLAHDRAAGLGHAVSAQHLVARSGSLTRRREMLATEHVIGWTLRDTWFQRRAGLLTLVATTAGGRGHVTLPDLPQPVAVAVAGRAVPGLIDQFTR